MNKTEIIQLYGGTLQQWRRYKNDDGKRGGWVHCDATIADGGGVVILAGAVLRGGYFHGGVFQGGYFHGGQFHDGVFRGGHFHDGHFHDGVFQGGVFRGGHFRGGVFRGGVFRGALHFQGSRHSATVCAPGEIAVGCEKHSFEDWLARIEDIGARNDYSQDQIQEYRAIVEFLIAQPEASHPQKEGSDDE